MKLIHDCRTPLYSFLQKNLSFCTSSLCKPFSGDGDDESQFVSKLLEIVRGKRSWKVAFNDSLISSTLRPHHVEKVLIRTIDDPKLALRFFNFLGLHQNFNHSPASFSIFVHALVQERLFWPANSLL